MKRSFSPLVVMLLGAACLVAALASPRSASQSALSPTPVRTQATMTPRWPRATPTADAATQAAAEVVRFVLLADGVVRAEATVILDNVQIGKGFTGHTAYLRVTVADGKIDAMTADQVAGYARAGLTGLVAIDMELRDSKSLYNYVQARAGAPWQITRLTLIP